MYVYDQVNLDSGFVLLFKLFINKCFKIVFCVLGKSHSKLYSNMHTGIIVLYGSELRLRYYDSLG